jgi:hypothetical protein
VFDVSFNILRLVGARQRLPEGAEQRIGVVNRSGTPGDHRAIGCDRLIRIESPASGAWRKDDGKSDGRQD